MCHVLVSVVYVMVITSSAELANLVEETLRDEPTKSLGEEADVEY